MTIEWANGVPLTLPPERRRSLGLAPVSARIAALKMLRSLTKSRQKTCGRQEVRLRDKRHDPTQTLTEHNRSPGSQ
jgi:hypothetical protein